MGKKFTKAAKTGAIKKRRSRSKDRSTDAIKGEK